VIDAALGTGGTLFAVAETWNGSTSVSIQHRLVAVNLATHAVSTANIDPTGVGFDTGTNRALEQQRGALTLAGGRVIVPYGGLAGDCGAYHGFVVSLPEDLSGTAATFQVAPSHTGGGIWAAGGPVVDGSGSVYVATGNAIGGGGTYCATPTTCLYSDGIVKLNNTTMAVQDYFAPTEWANDDAADLDLGSQGPLLIPRPAASPMVFITGKQLNGFLLNTAALSSNASHIGGELFRAKVCDQESFGASAYSAGYLYVPCREGLRGLTVNTSTPSFSRAWVGPGDATGPPIVAGGLVWTHGSNRLLGLDPTTGVPVVTLNGVNTAYNFSTPSTSGGMLFYVGGDVVNAFRSIAPGAGLMAGATGFDHSVRVFANSSPFVFKGGQLLGAPALAGIPLTNLPAEPLYFGTGLDHNIWVRSDARDWQPLTGGAYCIDNPAATVVGPPGSTTLYVACQGGDHGLWYTSGTVTAGSLPTLGGWTSLGGVLSAGPAVARIGGAITFMVTGSDRHIWSRTLSSGYQPFEARCIGHPALATGANGTAYFACDGMDGALWYATNPGGGWGGATSAGGRLIDGPGIAALTSPAFFVEGTDNSIWEWSSSGGWNPEGGQAIYGTAATVL
jgi:hypothetical protein